MKRHLSYIAVALAAPAFVLGSCKQVSVEEPEQTGYTYQDLSARLAAAGVESRPLWKPMHLQPVFRDAPAYVNGVSEARFRQGLCLPSGPLVTDDDVERIVEIIKN